MFEQSGTFKNEFLKLGIQAEDYDIQDEFGQTDNKIDLFAEIERGYDGKPSVFDGIAEDDLIMAFFPCIYFEALQMTYFMNECINLRRLGKKERYDNIIDRAEKRKQFYVLLYKLVAICDMRNLRLIIENPAVQPHYLLFAMNFIPPTFIDRDRTRRGDEFRKPTAYWFINCSPTFGESYTQPMIVRKINHLSGHIGTGVCDKERSMIAPEYARNFICDFILGKEIEISIPKLF